MKPYYEDGLVTLYHGDCREVLPSLTGDAVVTDPPYGVSFRENEWDDEIPEGWLVGTSETNGETPTGFRVDVP